MLPQGRFRQHHSEHPRLAAPFFALCHLSVSQRQVIKHHIVELEGNAVFKLEGQCFFHALTVGKREIHGALAELISWNGGDDPGALPCSSFFPEDLNQFAVR